MSLKLKQQHFVVAVGLVLSILSFQNCSRQGLLVSSEPSMKPMDSGTHAPDSPAMDEVPDHDSDPGKQDPDEDYSEAFKGVCSIFKNTSLPIPENSETNDVRISNKFRGIEIKAARDVSIESVAGNVKIGSARDVEIEKTAGQVIIEGAQRAKIHRGAGSVKVAANEITSLSGRAGALCLNAIKIGKISNLAGGTKVIAQEIEEITRFAGNIHIYRATVRRIADGVGKVCLYDGARVLDVENVRGRIEICK